MAEVFMENEKNASNKEKKLVLLGVIVAILAVAGLVYLSFSCETCQSGKAEIVQLKKEIPKVENLGAKIPQGIPAELILEQAPVKEGTVSRYGNGPELKSFSYYSAKEAQIIYKSYYDYFSKNNWILTNVNDSQSVKFLYAKKEKESVSVAISRELDGKVLVALSYYLEK